MKGFIKVTGSNSNKNIRLNVTAIRYYEPNETVNGNIVGTLIHLFDDSFQVTQIPEKIDEMIEEAQADAIEYVYGGGELA